MSRARRRDADQFLRALTQGAGAGLMEDVDEAEAFYAELTGVTPALRRSRRPPQTARDVGAAFEQIPVATAPTVSAPAPRGVAYDGTHLYTVHRTAGEVRRFDPVPGAAGTVIATLPRPANGVPTANNAFVGPTFVRRSVDELVIAEFGDHTVNDSAHGSGRLHALSTAGSYRGIIAARTPGDTFLWGPAGSADLGSGRLAQSSFWGNRVTAMNAIDGSARVEVDFSGLRGLLDPRLRTPMRVGPDPLALHPSGHLVIGDRNNGRLLYARPGARAAEMRTGLADPIGVTCLAGGDVVVVTKGRTGVLSACHRLTVALRRGVPAVTRARTLVEFPSTLGMARGCTTMLRAGRETIVVAIAADGTPGAFDGLYFVDPT
jgi:hypothetical protein